MRSLRPSVTPPCLISASLCNVRIDERAPGFVNSIIRLLNTWEWKTSWLCLETYFVCNWPSSARLSDIKRYMTSRQARPKKRSSALDGVDVDCEVRRAGQTIPDKRETYLLSVLGLVEWLNPPVRSRSATVQFLEDNETRKITEDKRWRLRNLEDEPEVVFSTLDVDHNISAYWSPNRAYFEATIVEKSDSRGKGRDAFYCVGSWKFFC